MFKPVNPYQNIIDKLRNPWNKGVFILCVVIYLMFIVLGIYYGINPPEAQSISFALGMINITQILWLIPTVALYVKYRKDMWDYLNQEEITRGNKMREVSIDELKGMVALLQGEDTLVVSVLLSTKDGHKVFETYLVKAGGKGHDWEYSYADFSNKNSTTSVLNTIEEHMKGVHGTVIGVDKLFITSEPE